MKRWLILSHGFNMDGRAASLTVTDKMPYLLAAGIEPIVLSAVTGEKDHRFLHEQLLPWGPSGLRFDFRHWMMVKVGRGWLYRIMTFLVSTILLPFIVLERSLVGLSGQSSWSLPAAWRGLRLVQQGRVDLVYSSGGAWSAHYAAYLIKRWTGVTWIAEIHDPMVLRHSEEDDGTSPRATKDARFLQRLEGLICQHADHVWWFTQEALNRAKSRHPSLGDKGFVVLPGAIPPGCQEPIPHHVYQKHLRIAHFGSLADDRSLAPLLEALHQFFMRVPGAKTSIQIVNYGSDLDGEAKLLVMRYHLQDTVITPGRVPADPVRGKSGRECSMELMRQADVLLLLCGNTESCSEYIPSKLYDYYWTQRPVFALSHRNPDMDRLLLDRGAYVSHTNDIASVLNCLESMWDAWLKQSLPVPNLQPITPETAVEQILKKIL